MKIIYFIYQLFIALPILLVATVLTYYDYCRHQYR